MIGSEIVRDPTEQEISKAAHRWCGRKGRETFYDDVLYFRNNWQALDGLRALVEYEILITEANTDPDAKRRMGSAEDASKQKQIVGAKP